MKHKLILIVLFTIIVEPIYAAEKEVMAAYVNLYNDPPERCGCNGCDNVPLMPNFATYFRDKLVQWGYTRSMLSSNMGVEWKEWADQAYSDKAYDHLSNGVDSFDAAFIMTHGSLETKITGQAIGSSLGMGNSTNDNQCDLDYGRNNLAQVDVKWGNSDLNYVVIFACNSIDYWGFVETGAYEHGRMRAPKLSAINGFFGNAKGGSDELNAFKGYVDSVQYNGIGEEWGDRMWAAWVEFAPGSSTPEVFNVCPTTLVYADNEADANMIYQFAGLNDLKGDYTGTSNNAFLYHYEGCRPMNRPRSN